MHTMAHLFPAAHPHHFVIGMALVSACLGPTWDGFMIDGAWDRDTAEGAPDGDECGNTYRAPRPEVQVHVIYDRADDNPVVVDTDQTGFSFYATPKGMESEHIHLRLPLRDTRMRESTHCRDYRNSNLQG